MFLLRLRVDPGFAADHSKKNRTYGTEGRLGAALCSIGPVAAGHTGHTGREGPFRPLSSWPEDAANHQERRGAARGAVGGREDTPDFACEVNGAQVQMQIPVQVAAALY
jgi:hypothetical protein